MDSPPVSPPLDSLGRRTGRMASHGSIRPVGLRRWMAGRQDGRRSSAPERSQTSAPGHSSGWCSFSEAGRHGNAGQFPNRRPSRPGAEHRQGALFQHQATDTGRRRLYPHAPGVASGSWRDGNAPETAAIQTHQSNRVPPEHATVPTHHKTANYQSKQRKVRRQKAGSMNLPASW